jgi:uncharacterized protein DUF4232
MFGKRRKSLLVSAALIGGAMLMTACQDSDSGSNAAKDSAPAAPPANPPASSTTNGNQSGGKDSAGQNSGGTNSSGQNSGGTNSSGANSGGKSSTGTNSGGTNSGGQGTSPKPASGGNGKVDKCLTDHLKITAMDATISGDTDGTVAVTFKNDGGLDCALSGYAGVDLVTSAGSLSAKRYGEPADLMTLKPGKSVSFGISYPINDSGGSGVRITDLLVTPPGETQSITLRWPGAATLPVTDGSGSPVKVGPIGSAGQGGQE